MKCDSIITSFFQKTLPNVIVHDFLNIILARKKVTLVRALTKTLITHSQKRFSILADEWFSIRQSKKGSKVLGDQVFL